MQFSDIRTLTKQYFDDNSGGQILTDAEYNRLINAAYRQLYNKASRKDQSWFVTSGTINWVAETREYSLPSACATGQIVYVERVATEGNYPIDIISFAQRYLYEGTFSHRYRGIGVPVAYLRDQSIGFLPTPGTTETGAVRVYYIPAVTELSADADVPVLPVDHHEIIAVAAALRALSSKQINAPELRAIYVDLWQDYVDAILARNGMTSRFVNKTVWD